MQFSSAQKRFFKPSDSLHKGRLIGVVSTETALVAGSYIGLHTVWYKNITKTKFHSFNDWPEWQQMDKMGHLYSAYTLGDVGYHALKWAGVNKNTSIAVGGSLGFAYLLGFEFFDAQAQEWGFSWSDIGANALGTGVFMAQQFLWDEQRIILKFSAQPSPYAKYRPNVLGDNFATRLLKDYNGQTYWMSLNLHSFMKVDTKFPSWINVAVGYSATGMTGGRENIEIIENGNPIYHDRYRQFLVSLDVDLTKIPVKKPWLKTLFNVLNRIKLPFPALEFNKNGVRGYWLYF